MAELTKTVDDLRRAYLHGLVYAATFSTTWHAIVRVGKDAQIEYWTVTP
jgi:hypothetical protein